MAKQIKESDWKLLRKKLPGWQEAHMGKLLESYAELLNADACAADRFWELEKRLEHDKRSTGVVVRDLSRSNATHTILALLADGVIALEDLEGFSDEVQKAARWDANSWNRDSRQEERAEL